MTSSDTVLTGNVVDDHCELRYTPTGRATARFRMAMSHRYRDDSGAWVDGDPTFMTVIAWGSLATNAAESLTKGARVTVLGQLRQRSYETTAGEKRTVYEVNAAEIAASLRYATAQLTRTSQRDDQDQEVTADR
jgi:single-strand DNA-binding protein